MRCFYRYTCMKQSLLFAVYLGFLCEIQSGLVNATAVDQCHGVVYPLIKKKGNVSILESVKAYPIQGTRSDNSSNSVVTAPSPSTKISLDEPIVSLSACSLPGLINGFLAFTDKFSPQMSGSLSMFILGLLGGSQCEGVDSTSPCYSQIFVRDNKIKPVLFFKAKKEASLVNFIKNSFGQESLQSFSCKDDNTTWWIFSERDLLTEITKDLEKKAPFLYGTSEPVNNLLSINFCTKTFEDILPFVHQNYRLIFNAFVKDNLERMVMNFDFSGENVHYEIQISAKPHGPAAAYFKSAKEKTTNSSFLNWDSQEAIQSQKVESYAALKAVIESYKGRMDKEAWGKDTIMHTIYQYCELVQPIASELLSIADKTLTGSQQGYASFDNQTTPYFQSRRFGFFERKLDVKGNPVSFQEFFDYLGKLFNEKLPVLKQQIVNKKLFGYEFLDLIKCEWTKNIAKHRDCDIHGFTWRYHMDFLESQDDKAKSEPTQSLKMQYPILLCACKGYLIYADNMEDMKRTIERMLDTKIFVTHPAAYLNEMTCRLHDIFALLQVKIDLKHMLKLTCSVKENSCCFHVNCPVCFDLGTLAKIGTDMLLKQTRNPIPVIPTVTNKVEDKK